MNLIYQILLMPDTRDYLYKLLDTTERELTDDWQALNTLFLNFSQLDYLWQLGYIECKIEPLIVDGCPKGGHHYYKKVQK